MPRKPGPFSTSKSTPRAVRLPNDLDAEVMAACGGQEKFAEWARNVFRVAVGRPLDHQAGYAEGRAAGWAQTSAEFKAALAERFGGGARPLAGEDQAA